MVRELLAEPDERAVEPAQHAGAVVDLGLEDGNARHEHGRGLLVDARRAHLGKVARDGGDAQTLQAAQVLVVVGDERRAGLERLAGVRGDAINFPCRRLANIDFGLADAHVLLTHGDAATDHAADVELLGRLDVECRVEAHLEVALRVLVEYAEIALLEDGRREQVGDDDDAVRRIQQNPHFDDTELVRTL